jgi:hypothetical protein
MLALFATRANICYVLAHMLHMLRPHTDAHASAQQQFLETTGDVVLGAKAPVQHRPRREARCEASTSRRAATAANKEARVPAQRAAHSLTLATVNSPLRWVAQRVRCRHRVASPAPTPCRAGTTSQLRTPAPCNDSCLGV